ncbi:MAG: hypothetical protein GXY44_12360 [Phycisphaerales bacterium]|nr:hypothetical protein [Phycisphaerales bacterium]
MCAILYSALQPVNAEALARIDCEFPDIAGELDMKRMKKESKDFKADVAAELPVDTDSATELKEIVQELDESLQDEPCVVQDQSQVVSSASDSEESSGIANDLDALLAEVQAETDEVLGEPEPVALDAVEDSSEDPSSVPEVITDVEGAMDEDPVQSVIPTPDGEEAIELATDSMADELVRHQEHLDAVASVFSEATQEIEDMAESINEVVGADECATTAEDEISTPAAECSDDVLPSPMRDDFPANGMATGIGSITQELRQEIESLKAGVLTQLDRAAALIEQMDGTYQRLEAMTSQATQWQQALEEAHQAGQRFAATQMAAVTAREDFEQAQARADDACRMWHAANEKSVAEACVAVQS